MAKSKEKNYYSEIEKLVLTAPKPIYVAFAVYCARDQLHEIKDEKLYRKCNDALAVVERFMRGQASQAEVEAAYSAASAASAASSVVSATSAAYSATYSNKSKQYYEKLGEMLQSLSKLEKIIYNIPKV